MSRQSVFPLVAIVLSALACGGDATPARVVSPVASQPTSAPEATKEAQPGQDLAHPLPVGQAIQSGNVTLQIGQVTRPGDAIIAEGNMFNPTPEPGNEFVIVELVVSCSAPGDEKCRIGISLELTMVGDRRVIYEPESFIAGVPGLLESPEMLGGASVTGGVVFEVGQGEGNLVLSYEPFISLDPAVYLAIQ